MKMTPDEQNEAIRAQVEREMPTPAGGFENEDQRDEHRAKHGARFLELCAGGTEQHPTKKKNMKNKPVKMTLSNSFHGTEIRVMIPDGFQPNGQTEAFQWFEQNRPATAKRIKRTLCGYADCKCGIVRK